MSLDKRAVVAALLASLERELETMTRAAAIAREAATHEEMKPENDKDTRSLEAGYLAGAQSARAAELSRAVQELRAMRVRSFASDDAIDVGALVELCDLDGDKRTWTFVAAHGGGAKLKVGAADVQVVTPQAPLGAALVGKTVGDVVELTSGKKRELEVVSVL